MRLTQQQQSVIRFAVVETFGGGASVWLFGSRLDDQKKGGDIDLYVEASPHAFLDELRCKVGLQESLDMPVDLIVRQPSDHAPIAIIAKTEGVRL